jgi:holin-like protein
MHKIFALLRFVSRKSSFLQVGLLAAFWALGEALARLSGLPIPGGVIGMAIVLTLLSTGWLSPSNLRGGASWLLAEMLLFFIPTTLAVLDHREFLTVLGLKLMAVIVAGTVSVMCGTALTIDLLHRWHLRQAAE